MRIKDKLFQKIVGYLAVAGVIVIVTAVLVWIENKNNSVNKGEYSEYIKEGISYPVLRVLDGDTLIADIAHHEVTVRLMGIDTPEVMDPRKPVQCYGPEASEKAKALLTGKSVYLEKESAKGNYDIYGRVLAYVKMPSGFFYNAYMIENGFAREYTFNNEKYKYQKEFKALQKTAKKEKLGLWGKCPILSI